MLTNGQKRKLLTDLLIPEQHIKIEEGDYDRNSDSGVREGFSFESELVQDLSMAKPRYGKFESQTVTKLSDDENDSRSVVSNQDAPKLNDNSDSLATEDEDDNDTEGLYDRLNGTRTQLPMNRFNLDLKGEMGEQEAKSNASLELDSKFDHNDECAPKKEEEGTLADKTMDNKVDEKLHAEAPDTASLL